jgi:hypothetical protein
MDASLRDLAKQGHEKLVLLVELAELTQLATILGNMGYLYNERYLHNDTYREALETGLQW